MHKGTHRDYVAPGETGAVQKKEKVNLSPNEVLEDRLLRSLVHSNKKEHRPELISAIDPMQGDLALVEVGLIC